MTNEELAEAKRMLRLRMLHDLQVVRAFVARVEKRVTQVDEYDYAAEAWCMLKEELAAMERENEQPARPRPSKDHDPGGPASR